MKKLALVALLLPILLTPRPGHAFVEWWGEWICISGTCIDIGFTGIWDLNFTNVEPPTIEPGDYVPPLLGIPVGVGEFIDLLNNEDLEFYPVRKVNAFIMTPENVHLWPDQPESDFDFTIIGNKPGGHLHLYRGTSHTGTLIGECTNNCNPSMKEFSVTYDYSAFGDAEWFTMYNCHSAETMPNCADKQSFRVRVYDHWYIRGLNQDSQGTVAHMHDYNSGGFSDLCDHFQSATYGASMAVCPTIFPNQGYPLRYHTETSAPNVVGGYNIFVDSAGDHRVKFLDPDWLLAGDSGINYLGYVEITTARDYGERLTNHYCQPQFAWPGHSKFEGGTTEEFAVREIYRYTAEAIIMLDYGLDHFDEYVSKHLNGIYINHEWYPQLSYILSDLRGYYTTTSPTPTVSQMVNYALGKWDRASSGGDDNWKPILDGEIIQPTLYCWTKHNNQ